ncbi:MAG: hypothetical protein IKX88_01305 [Thermoguttaceae bacterium]|nr:hypothetical protein [Thermoguttaceae bacterium]
MILLRTEDSAVVPDLKGENINGEKTARNKTYLPGVCESYGHIVASNINPVLFPEPKSLTVVRVPFSRVHSLWFMERGEIDSSGAYSKMPFRLFGQNDDGDFQFWAYHQNEIDACTQELPIINVGDISKITNSREEAETTLKNWENPNGHN